MRFVKISSKELVKIRELYEGLMSYACYGLFFREGVVIGEEFAEAVKESGEEYFKAMKNVLEHRGWASEVSFEDGKVTIKDSAEVEPGSESETCHRLRGILQKVLEIHHGKKIRCTEKECKSTGGERCVFIYEFID